MKIEELQRNVLVADGQTLLKVSTVYDDRVTATVVYPLRGRTTVVSFTPEEVARWKEPSQQLVNKYEDAYGLHF